MKPAMDPRAQELLVERALRPLDDREHWELEELGAQGDDSFDLAAAAVAVAMTPIEAMPAHLAEKIAAASFDAMKTVPGTSLLPGQLRTLPGVVAPTISTQQPIVPPAREPAPVDEVAARRDKQRSRPAVIAPWLAAAACLLLAIGTWWWSRRDTTTVAVTPTAPTASEARAQLLASAKDISTIEWTATADPTAQGASGDVVWSQAEQKGFMRFVGLAPNDAKQFQYQLWIFDKNRDEAFPVDGGVFDVTSTGEVIVPISAKLAVSDATLFAVTIEKPGGVVVSKRERIVVTAARKS